MTMLEKQLIELTTTQSVLKQVIATMISRSAREYEDPAQYVMTLLAPILAGAEEFDTTDEVGELASATMYGLHDDLESAALELLQ